MHILQKKQPVNTSEMSHAHAGAGGPYGGVMNEDPLTHDYVLSNVILTDKSHPMSEFHQISTGKLPQI